MLPKFLLQQLLFVGVSLSKTIQTCIWKSGVPATNYLPCGNETATTGNCCLKGEACLANGLCYGGVGLVYRGACLNTWGGDCLTICDDVANAWANLFPCAFAGTGSQDGPQSWWCGLDGTNQCTSGNGTHTFNMNPSVATRILSATSTSSASSTSTGSSTTGSLATPSPNSTLPEASSKITNTAQQTSKCAESVTYSTGPMIGIGIGLGSALVMSLVAGGWSYHLYRGALAQIAILSTAPRHSEQKCELSGVGTYAELDDNPGGYRDSHKPPVELGGGALYAKGSGNVYGVGPKGELSYKRS